MSVTAEEVYEQVNATIRVLEKLTAKEREGKPTQQFAANYNQYLALAKEVLPDADSRLWPPEVKIEQSMGGHVNFKFLEFQVFFTQISTMLGGIIEPIDVQFGQQ